MALFGNFVRFCWQQPFGQTVKFDERQIKLLYITEEALQCIRQKLIKYMIQRWLVNLPKVFNAGRQLFVTTEQAHRKPNDC